MAHGLAKTTLPKIDAVTERLGPLTEPGQVLWLKCLNLHDFRNYGAARLETDGRPVVLTGPNGAGKTNLLEAISLLAPGRGLRRARLAEINRRERGSIDPGEGSESAAPTGNRNWAVAAEVMTPEGLRDLGTGCDPGPAESGQNGTGPNGADDKTSSAIRERRLVKIDGRFQRGQQGLGEIIGLVWVTPQMDGLFRDGPGARRRFLDRLVFSFDPAHAGRSASYQRALRERARLLKGGTQDGAWLNALEETLSGHAVAVAAARRALVARLAEVMVEACGAFPKAGLRLAGEVEDWLEVMPALAVEEEIRKRLRDSRPRDAESGGAAVGPHRSDLMVLDLDKDLAAETCSTGEQKALLIAIVLAHARLVALERGAAPILLLDEIAAHLDCRRRAALFDEILALGAQAWLTGTDRALFQDLGASAQFVEVLDGCLELLDRQRDPDDRQDIRLGRA